MRKEKSPDPTKRYASREEFGRSTLAGGNMWESLSCLLTFMESFDKHNPEIWSDTVARQIHQKTVKNYWENMVKQQVTSVTRRHVNSADGDGSESTHVSDTGAGAVMQSDSRAYNTTKRRG